MAALDQKPRSACVVAAVRSRVLQMDEVTFWRLLNCSHEFAVNLLGVLSERLRGNTSTLHESRRLQLVHQRHASVDALMGLHNRRWLNDMVPRQVQRCRQQGQPLCLVMADVDHFKALNDQHGHPAGDAVLVRLAQVLTARLRPSDMVVRYGGEEFLVVLPDTSLEGGLAAANRARAAVSAQAWSQSGFAIPSVTVSMGVAEMGADRTLDQRVHAADQALYRAKREGRDRCCAEC